MDGENPSTPMGNNTARYKASHLHVTTRKTVKRAFPAPFQLAWTSQMKMAGAKKSFCFVKNSLQWGWELRLELRRSDPRERTGVG